MPTGRTVFAQVMQWLPRYEFAKCVARYRGDVRVRALSCYEQFLALAYAQLTGRESLRDIETCLLAHRAKLFHSGFGAPVRRSTLADANENRDWRIFAVGPLGRRTGGGQTAHPTRVARQHSLGL